MSKMDIPKDYDHAKESMIAENWEKSNVYRFIGDGTKPTYIIDTPPPYPTGTLHMGHVLNWVYIDLIARYKRMNGFDVLFPQGWDCHGLPTEVKVEETHNIKKNDVSKEKFREYCIDLTHENIDKMRVQMRNMGYSQDWEHEYVTMLPENKRRTQLSFLKLYDDNLIHQAVHPINWCPRCETAIALAEVEYSENVTKLNYVDFHSHDSEDVITIATTRPELLCACVAIVVHPDDEKYTSFHGKTIRLPLYDRDVKVITDDSVDPEYGTGAVMICTFGDNTDVSWVNKYDLDIIDAITEDGLMQDVAGKYSGMSIKECRKNIIDDLKNEGYLIKQEDVDQNVGLCWRCKTPIEILVKKQWFISVKKMTKDILRESSKIKWTPEHMETRLINWANSMDWDWCISRQRIFATPIPVWYCDDCHKPVLPTVEQLPIDPVLDTPDKSCDCGCNSFTPEEDVLDTWMDSSITPLTVANWPNEGYDKIYPANLRPQGHDIIRTWAFYTILRCYALTGIKPFDEIVVNGMVFGEDGHKMSKSRGNVTAPEEVLNEYGADTLRLWSANSTPGSDVPFAWKDIKYSYKFLRKFWNAFRFISMHIDTQNRIDKDSVKLELLDQWILSKLNTVITDVTKSFEDYNFAKAEHIIYDFVWHDFCDEYIEAVKYRLYDDLEDSTNAAKYTLLEVIEKITAIMAPITPFFSDTINYYLENDTINLHKNGWPKVDKSLINKDIEESCEIAINIIDIIRRYKSSHGIPLNQDINSVTIHTSNTNILENTISDIENTNKITNLNLIKGKPDVHEKIIEIEPIMSKLGPKFKQDAKKVISYIQNTPIETIAKELEENNEVVIEENIIFNKEDINTTTELQSKTGKKVEILQTDYQDITIEIIN
ncbi:MAG: valine--tRNA ligase [Methanobacteriaceae archaeon]|nr:valine--tRNA ligase [Methanobacteriaceae archaeon]